MSEMWRAIWGATWGRIVLYNYYPFFDNNGIRFVSYGGEVNIVGNIGDLVGNIGILVVGIRFVSYGGGVNIVGNIGNLVVGINLINRTY